jgi:hypothetical protein
VLNVSLESARVRFLVAKLWRRSDVKGAAISCTRACNGPGLGGNRGRRLSRERDAWVEHALAKRMPESLTAQLPEGAVSDCKLFPYLEAARQVRRNQITIDLYQ